MEKTLTLVAEKRHTGKMVRDILKTELCVSRRLLNRLKKEGGIRINSNIIKDNYCLNEGDILSVHIKDAVTSALELCHEKIDIVFENSRMLVVNKRAGMAVHPSRNEQSGTLANVVAAYYAENNEQTIFRPINRIDRDTSGLVLIAKDSHTAAALCKLSKNRMIKKEYTAVVCANIQSPCGTIDMPIKRQTEGEIKRAVIEGGQEAKTDYILIKHLNDMSVVKVMPLTGRTHQIRVHFSHIGYPLCGDKMYGGNADKIFRQALHLGSMSFIDPESGEKVELYAPLADDMAQLICANEKEEP